MALFKQTFITILMLVSSSLMSKANFDQFAGLQDLDISAHYWNNIMMENSSLNMPVGCNYCNGELFYHEPPPDIMFIPPPPLHPALQSSLPELMKTANDLYDKQQFTNSLGGSCSFCNIMSNEPQLGFDENTNNQSMNNRVVLLLVSFLMISFVLFIYLFNSRKTKIIASLSRAGLFKSNHDQAGMQTVHRMDKGGTINDSTNTSNAHIIDPYFLQTNRDKNLTSPIINDHMKTSIPSKCWAQPGSIIGRTIRRIPNEYEVPSSHTNSTGTSSAVYADMNNIDGTQRFFSPYNLHTYAEVREVLDPNEHFHTSSNSSVMLSESNYDNAVYSHGGNCVLANRPMTMTGSVQMSDFNNSVRPMQQQQQQQMAFAQASTLSGQNQAKMMQGQSVYEQPPQRAQIIITSNNQGVNPTLLNYKDRIHNVI